MRKKGLNALFLVTLIMVTVLAVLITGGSDYLVSAVSAGDSPSLPLGGTWTDTGALGTARYNHTSTLLSGGKVLAGGGS